MDNITLTPRSEARMIRDVSHALKLSTFEVQTPKVWERIKRQLLEEVSKSSDIAGRNGIFEFTLVSGEHIVARYLTREGRVHFDTWYNTFTICISWVYNLDVIESEWPALARGTSAWLASALIKNTDVLVPGDGIAHTELISEFEGEMWRPESTRGIPHIEFPTIRSIRAYLDKG